MLAPDSLARAGNKKLDAAKLLDDNDGYGFFSAPDDLVVTGPTRTNVNDYRADRNSRLGRFRYRVTS